MVQHNMEMSDSAPKWHQGKTLRIGVGVLLFALIAFGIYALLPKKNDRLVSEFFEPYPAVDFVAAKAADTKVNQAILAYQEGDYQEAIEKFDITPEYAGDLPALFFKANAYLAIGDPLFAIGILEQFNAVGQTAGDPRVQWYLSLAYLKHGQMNKARSLLKKVAEQPSLESYKKIEAMQLLDKLKGRK